MTLPTPRGQPDGMETELTISEILNRAGGVAKVAQLCGVTRTTPYSWTAVPPQHVAVIAVAIDEPMVRIRPDLFKVKA